jgi:uncharacterized membrane protein
MQNLHPLIVHFPIALLLLAVLFELIHLFVRRTALDSMARRLLYLGALAALVTAASGWYAEQTVAPVAAAHDALEKHEKAGYVSLGLAAILAFWRVATARRNGPRPRWAFTLVMLALAGLLVFTAHEGGELVYEYGVGTEITAPGGPLAEDPSESSEHEQPDVPTGEDFR